MGKQMYRPDNVWILSFDGLGKTDAAEPVTLCYSTRYTAKEFAGKDIKTQLIGIYKGPGITVYPDYADECLETHRDKEVEAYQYRKDANLLIVQLKEEN